MTSRFLLVPGIGLLLACSTAEPGRLPEGDRLFDTPAGEVLSSDYCSSPRPGESPLRRLTNAEYRNTLEALGLERSAIEAATASLPSEPISLGFRNGARTLNVDSLMAQEYARIAEHFRDKISPSCAPEEEARSCARAFIEGLGRRLYRRPLTNEEVDDFLELYDQARAGGDSLAEASAWIVEGLLQSPDFLYRVEIPEQEVARVTGFEMASRLSYMLWQEPPDEQLLNAAERGELETKEQVLAQAERLLRDERALRVYEFFEQWLDLDELSEVRRDEALYPGLPGNLGLLLRTESQAFISALLSRGDADLTELLTADYTYANQALATHYGLSGPEGPLFERVPAEGRSGILTQAMLAVQDGTTRTSIVRRGLKIRTDFLCQLVPAPPDTVDLTLEGIGEEMTQAERLELHSANNACSACHRLMDPLGVVFEGFDAVGRSRTVDEYGAPIATSGEVAFSADLDGEYQDVASLALSMAESREVEECYLIQNFRFFFGRDVERADLCSQAQLTAHFQGTGQALAELFVGLVQTDAFLYKAARSGPEEPAPEAGGGS